MCKWKKSHEEHKQIYSRWVNAREEWLLFCLMHNQRPINKLEVMIAKELYPRTWDKYIEYMERKNK